MPKRISSYWFKSGFFTLLERGSSLFFGVMTFVLLARTLDKESYGTWMLYLSLTSFIEVARIGLLKNPLIRMAQDRKTSFGRLQSTVFVVNVAAGILVTLILLLTRQGLGNSWGAPGLSGLLGIYCTGFILFSLYSHLDFIQAANLNFRGPSLAIITEKLLFFSSVVFFLVSGTHLEVMYLGWVHLASVFGGILVSFAWGRKYFMLWRRPHLELGSEILNYGKYTLGTNLSATLLRNIDTWMIGWIMNPAAVATYNVAMRVANLFETPTQALAQILFPKAIKEIKQDGSKAFKRLYERSVALILLASIPFTLVVILFSDEIVTLLAGPNYPESGNVLIVTVLLGLLIPFNKQLGILMDADGMAKVNMLFVIRNAATNALLNFFMITHYGVMGAAFATLLTFVLSLFIENSYARKHYGVSLLQVFKEMKYWAWQIKRKMFNKGEFN